VGLPLGEGSGRPPEPPPELGIATPRERTSRSPPLPPGTPDCPTARPPSRLAEGAESPEGPRVPNGPAERSHGLVLAPARWLGRTGPIRRLRGPPRPRDVRGGPYHMLAPQQSEAASPYKRRPLASMCALPGIDPTRTRRHRHSGRGKGRGHELVAQGAGTLSRACLADLSGRPQHRRNVSCTLLEMQDSLLLYRGVQIPTRTQRT
jgi:hypothetical protein